MVFDYPCSRAECSRRERCVSKEKWYQSGLSFECTQCGNCCSGPPGYVWVTKKDIETIARFIGLEDGKLDARYLRRVGLRHSLTERAGGDCIFLKRANGKSMCSIYPVRPLQCRTWPFWSDNLSSKDAWNRAGLTCPGIDRGKYHGFVSIEEIRLRKPE